MATDSMQTVKSAWLRAKRALKLRLIARAASCHLPENQSQNFSMTMSASQSALQVGLLMPPPDQTFVNSAQKTAKHASVQKTSVILASLASSSTLLTTPALRSAPETLLWFQSATGWRFANHVTQNVSPARASQTSVLPARAILVLTRRDSASSSVMSRDILKLARVVSVLAVLPVASLANTRRTTAFRASLALTSTPTRALRSVLSRMATSTSRLQKESASFLASFATLAMN